MTDFRDTRINSHFCENLIKPILLICRLDFKSNQTFIPMIFVLARIYNVEEYSKFSRKLNYGSSFKLMRPRLTTDSARFRLQE